MNILYTQIPIPKIFNIVVYNIICAEFGAHFPHDALRSHSYSISHEMRIVLFISPDSPENGKEMFELCVSACLCEKELEPYRNERIMNPFTMLLSVVLCLYVLGCNPFCFCCTNVIKP